MFYNVRRNDGVVMTWYDNLEEASQRAHELNLEYNTNCGEDDGFQVADDNGIFHNEILFQLEGWC